MWRKSNEEDVDLSESYLKEFVEGTKDTKFGRLFILIFNIRRILSVTCLILLKSLPIIVRTIAYAFLQFCFLLYTFSRPLKIVKENVIECLNDISYFLMCTALIYFNSEDVWSDFLRKLIRRLCDWAKLCLLGKLSTFSSDLIYSRMIQMVASIKAGYRYFVKKCLQEPKRVHKGRVIDISPTG